MYVINNSDDDNNDNDGDGNDADCFSGTAVSVVLMFGRIGSVIGANVSASTLVTACSATFYVYAVLMAGNYAHTLGSLLL